MGENTARFTFQNKTAPNEQRYVWEPCFVHALKKEAPADTYAAGEDFVEYVLWAIRLFEAGLSEKWELLSGIVV